MSLRSIRLAHDAASKIRSTKSLLTFRDPSMHFKGATREDVKSCIYPDLPRVLGLLD